MKKCPKWNSNFLVITRNTWNIVNPSRLNTFKLLCATESYKYGFKKHYFGQFLRTIITRTYFTKFRPLLNWASNMSKRLLHFLNFKWTKEIRSLRNQNQIIATQQSLKLFLLQVSNITFWFLFLFFTFIGLMLIMMVYLPPEVPPKCLPLPFRLNCIFVPSYPNIAAAATIPSGIDLSFNWRTLRCSFDETKRLCRQLKSYHRIIVGQN